MLPGLNLFSVGVLLDNREIVEDVNAFARYSTMAIFDPKMPLEYKALGGAYVASNIVAGGALLWWIDPLGLRTNRGLDESWSSIYSPLHGWSSDAWSEVKSWNPIPDEAPTVWTFW